MLGCALPVIFTPPAQHARATFCSAASYPLPRSVQPAQRGRVCSAAAFRHSRNLYPRPRSVGAQLQWASRQYSTWSPAWPSSPLPWPTSCPDTIVLFLLFLPPFLCAFGVLQDRALPLVVAEISGPQPWSVVCRQSLIFFLPNRPSAPPRAAPSLNPRSQHVERRQARGKPERMVRQVPRPVAGIARPQELNAS